MITRYKTETGSTYEVRVSGEVTQARRVIRSESSRSERVTGDWRDCMGAVVSHGCLLIAWGTGMDEHSTDASLGDSRLRTTLTSRVLDIEELAEQ